jgi:hypothetical protein
VEHILVEIITNWGCSSKVWKKFISGSFISTIGGVLGKHSNKFTVSWITSPMSSLFSIRKWQSQMELGNKKRAFIQYILPIEDTTLDLNKTTHPIIYEESAIHYNFDQAKEHKPNILPSTSKEEVGIEEIRDQQKPASHIVPLERKNPKKNSFGSHLVVLIHGFAGNMFDLRLIRIFLSFLFPRHYFLSCLSISNTHRSLQVYKTKKQF